MIRLVGDFETTTQEEDVRVWASCLVDIDSLEVAQLGNDIEGFIEYVEDKNTTVYFHNLKFDGEFILHWLLTHDYTHSRDKLPGTFSTLITNEGTFYSITIYFSKNGKKWKKCVIYDSLKKFPNFSVARLAKTFKLPDKGDCDYKLFREKGHKLTLEEREYVVSDCMIVAKALQIQFSQGLEKMTIGSDALNGFKDSISKRRFEDWFPVLPLEIDADIRRAYKGGFTWLNPKYKDLRQKGQAYDVNSLYPSVMWGVDNTPLPFGTPVWFDGEYVYDEIHPLHILRFECEFILKKDHIPTVQLKNNRSFIETDYLSNSLGEIIEMTMTDVDFKLFLEHYDVYNLQFISGYKFKQMHYVFRDYIDKWAAVKAKSKGGIRELSKLMLNSLYGKFAKNPLSILKSPYLREDGIVGYTLDDPEYLDPVYTAVGAFITAYARAKTIRTAQTVYSRFMYADTDSIHLKGFEPVTGITVHPTDLGAWGFEGYFSDSNFMNAKRYMETPFTPISEGIQLRRGLKYNGALGGFEGPPVVKCAGMPDNVKKFVTYENFVVGSRFEGKLTPKRCEGGIVLEEGPFTIKAR